ncbi:MAG: PAS domain S-box protein, partial [Gammaproteobacteria bacterium]|nr:PAS domain S-box protein [Gammaproteobacteria bacterium]
MLELETRVKHPPPSLRTRYFTLTLMLGFLVISSVLFFYGDVVSTKRKVIEQLDSIHEKLNALEIIRHDQVDFYRNLDLFLLDPSQGGHDESIISLISNSVQATKQLSTLLQRDQSELLGAADDLENRLIQLRDVIKELVETRLDINRQYPGMAISANIMTLPQQEAVNDLQILIDEIESGDLEPVSEALYPTLLKTYTLWIRHVAQVRIYLANRLASFSTEILIAQATSLNELNRKLQNNISKLEALYSNEDSFEGAELIKSIRLNATEWMALFYQVREISESDRWRSDSHIMRTKIIPQTDYLSALILNFENSFRSEEKVVNQHLKSATDTLSTLLFVVIALFLIFVFAIIFSLDRMIFRPISGVVDALQSMAFNKESLKLRAGKSREIDFLIKAYQHMAEQVNQRQEALRTNEQLLRTMAENYPNAYVSIIENDFTIGFTSGQEFKKLNLDPKQFIGQSLEQFFGENATSIHQQYEKTFAGKECSFEMFIHNQYQLYHTVPLYSEDGSIPRILTVVENITERKLAAQAVHDSAERYQTIFEGAPEGVWVIGSDRSTLEVNRRLCEMLGYRREEMIGKTPLDFADEKNQKIFKERTGKIETTNRREYEIELRHKDGHNIAAYFSATTLHTTEGGVLEAVAFVTDLTEQKIAERALRRAQKMDAVGQLTGGIAHDFNNILAIILGNLDLLKRQVASDDRALKRVESMKKAGQRAADLTKQLLGFSRSKAGQQTVTDINQVIGAMDSLISRMLTPEIEVKHLFADELWSTEIDPGDFEDALLNLSINARDAMAGHGQLTIETRNTTLDAIYCAKNPTASPGEYVELSVSDSGEGIPQDQQEHIFEPFYTTKEPGKGTGLGLSMVFGFVKRSGGYINVYSELGIGTTFKLYLPRAGDKSQSITEKSVEQEILPHGQETILIVDD